MNFEAALAALEARMTSKLAMLERDVQSGLYSSPPDMPWLGRGADSPHDFDPRWDADGKLYRTSGNRCVEGSAWQPVGERELGTGTGTCWMRWTNTTDLQAGAWDEGFGEDPEPTPEQDQTCTVIKLWTITEVDGVNQVQYHNRGAVRVIDWKIGC